MRRKYVPAAELKSYGEEKGKIKTDSVEDSTEETVEDSSK